MTNGLRGYTGNGIESISKTGTTGLVDTYTIIFTDENTTTFTVTNGKGISNIEKKASAGLIDTYRINYNDGTYFDYTVTNGKDGEVTEEELQDMYEQMSSEMETGTLEGESVDISDGAYWKIDTTIKGNTSQEVIAEVIGTTVSGTDITINDYDDTKESKFTKLFGNTEQDSYEGYNELDSYDDYDKISNGLQVKINSNGTITLNGTPTAEVDIVLKREFSNWDVDTYTAIINQLPTNSLMVCFNSGWQTLVNLTPANLHGSFILPQNKIIRIHIYIRPEAGTLNNYVLKPMLYKGEYDNSKDYEPFVGGQAAPNPQYPQEIRVVTGEINVKVENKNLFTSELESGAYDNNGNKLTQSGMIRNKTPILVNSSTTYILSNNGNGIAFNVLEYDINNIFIKKVVIDSGVAFTTTLTTKYINVFRGDNLSEYIIQLEQSSTVTDYIPHQEQNYPVSLGNIEIYKNGYIYGKPDKWYIYNEMGKLILNGAENWTSPSEYRFALVNISPSPINRTDVYATYYKKGTTATTNNTIALSSGTGYNNVYIHDERFTTVEDFKQYLSQNPLTLYYFVKTPIVTPITDLVLTSQLNAIYETQGYQGTTYITSSQVLPLEYQEVEYIENIGTSYINLNFNQSGYKSETEINWNNISRRQLMGGNGVGYFGINNEGYYEVYQASNYKAKINQWDKVVFKVEKDDTYSYRTLIVNDNTLIDSLRSTALPSGNIYLFRIPESSEYSCLCKIKYQKIWDDNNILVRDLIPCYRKSDNVIGMYDLVNGVFYTNQGTGTFLKGNDVNNLAIISEFKYNFITPAPSPDRASDIQVVTGENSVKVQNKNLISNIDIYNGYVNGTYNNPITFSLSANSITYKKCCYVEANETYILSWKINTPKAEGNRDIKITDDNDVVKKNISYSNANNNNMKSFTPNVSGWVYASLDANATEIQIEKKTTATSYVEHREQNYPISLGDKEIYEEGKIYGEPDEWYIYNEMNKKVLDGTENYSLVSTTSEYYEFQLSNLSPHSVDDYSFAISNYFSNQTNNRIVSNVNRLLIRIPANENITTVEELIAWLSNNNVILYYKLKTPVSELITDPTLISQLNDLYKAKSYQGISYITVDAQNEQPILSIDYKKSNLLRLKALEEANS